MDNKSLCKLLPGLGGDRCLHPVSLADVRPQEALMSWPQEDAGRRELTVASLMSAWVLHRASSVIL